MATERNIYESLHTKLGRQLPSYPLINVFHTDVIDETKHFDVRSFVGMLNIFVLFNITRPRLLKHHTEQEDDVMYEINLETLNHSLIPIFRKLYATNINTISLMQLRTLCLILNAKAQTNKSIDFDYVVDAWIKMYETRVSPIADKRVVVSLLKKAYNINYYLHFHWIWFHAAAAILHAASDPLVNGSLLQLFKHYSALLDCETCASHFDETIAKNPKKFNESVEEYFIRIHGVVRQNDYLSMQGASCPDRKVPVDDLIALYRKLFTSFVDDKVSP